MRSFDFDMMFTFVYVGWEGTTNDACVFLDACLDQKSISVGQV